MSKITFPSSAILYSIQERHIYKDEFSIEKSTGVIKRKYKLAAKWPDSLRSQNIRLFFVSTSNSASTKTRTRAKITRNDYTACNLSSLKRRNSYYDLTKREILSGKDVLIKVNDIRNGFKDVATISEQAFNKFLGKTQSLTIQARPPIGVKDIIDIANSVVDEEYSEPFLKKLHLIV